MDLKEYNEICIRIEQFCINARNRAPYCDEELFDKIVKHESKLLPEYTLFGENLLDACEDLKHNPARGEKIRRYRQSFAVYNIIQTLIDDIEADKVCPGTNSVFEYRGRLLVALNGLKTLCSSLSGMCFAEFDRIESIGLNKSIPPFKELLSRQPEALEYLKGKLDQEHLDCLDKDYHWKENCSQYYMADIVRTIRKMFPDWNNEGTASFLGVKAKQITNALQNYPD